MTIRYVDVSLSGNTTEYDKDAAAGSRDTGGPANTYGYPSLTTAQTGVVSGADTVICREGTDLNTWAAARQVNKVYGLEPYANETFTLHTEHDNHIFLFVAASAGFNWTCKKDGGQIIFDNQVGTNAGKGLFSFNASWGTITDPIAILGSRTAPGISFINFFADFGSAQTIRITRPHVISAGKMLNSSAALSNITLEIEMPFCENTSFDNINNVVTMNIYNPLIIPGGTLRCIGISDGKAATINIYGPEILYGAIDDSATLSSIYAGSTGTINLYGGVYNGNPFDPDDLSISGTVNLNNSPVNNGVIQHTNIGSNKCIISPMIWDSTAGSNDFINDMIPVLSGVGGTGTWCPDDSKDFKAGGWQAKIDSAIDWLAAGHEFGNMGYSGMLPSNDDPVTLDYVGAKANAQLVISSDGNTWTFTADAGVADVDSFVLDVSRGTATYGALGLNVPSAALAEYLEDNTNWRISKTIADNLDDTYTYTLEAGTYVDDDTIPYDRDRMLNEEVDVSKSELEDGVGSGTVTSYFVRSSVVVADLKARIIANGGYTSAQGAYGSNDRILNTLDATIDSFEIPKCYSLDNVEAWKGTGYDALNAANKQIRLEEAARCVASVGMYYGGWHIIEISPSTTFTAAEWEIFFAELVRNGVDIMSVGDADAWRQANTVTPVTETLPAAPSALSDSVGTGIKWWGTDPRPTGMDEEPFPDTDTDSGPSQSTLSSNHPENL